MPNVFTIHDPMVSADTVVFVSDTRGAAASYFYNYSIVVKRKELILFQVSSIEQDPDTGLNVVVDLQRIEICRMPEESNENF